MAENCNLEITPYAVSKLTRNNNIHSLSYTNQDYSSLKARVFDLIKQKYSDIFNDFNESSLAVMLIEAWAFMTDQMSFKIDQVANEIFVDTCTELPNMIRLAQLVGFKPTPPLPAKCNFILTLNHKAPTDVPIETPLRLGFLSMMGGERIFELFPADTNNEPVYNQPIVVAAGESAKTGIVGIEGESQIKKTNGTGLPWQSVFIDIQNILWKSVKVSVDGNYWTEVDYFTSSQPRQEYRLEYLSKYRAVVIFGDNKTGLAPQRGSLITTTFRTGGGVAGNIITGAIDKTVPITAQGLGYMLSCNIKNYTMGEGGYNGDTIDDIRYKLPIYLKTQGRAVTGPDYKALCDGFATATNGIVGKSLVGLRNSGCSGNIIDLYILAKDGNINLRKANDNLKKELSQELLKRKMFSDYLCIRDGQIVLVDIVMDVLVENVYKRDERDLREKIGRRLAEFFSLNNWEYGQSLKDGDLIKILADIKELEQIDITFTTEKSIEGDEGGVSLVSTNFNEILRPDNIHVNFNYK